MPGNLAGMPGPQREMVMSLATHGQLGSKLPLAWQEYHHEMIACWLRILVLYAKAQNNVLKIASLEDLMPRGELPRDSLVWVRKLNEVASIKLDQLRRVIAEVYTVLLREKPRFQSFRLPPIVVQFLEYDGIRIEYSDS